MVERVLSGTATATRAVAAADDESGETADIGAELTDEELTELALAADPELPLDADAVPITSYLDTPPGLLPAWYMPAVAVGRASRLRRAVVLAIVAAFLLVTAAGLCATYGQVVVA